MFTSYAELWHYILDNYNEEEQFIIEKLISHYMNEYNGLNNQNCKISYESYIKYDIKGELNKLALIGVEFEKTICNRSAKNSN